MSMLYTVYGNKGFLLVDSIQSISSQYVFILNPYFEYFTDMYSLPHYLSKLSFIILLIWLYEFKYENQK